MADGAGHDNTRAPSEELLGSDCGQSQVSKALLPDAIRSVVEGEIASMGRDARLVGHSSVGGVSLVVLDMEPLDVREGHLLCERRWIVVVEEQQVSGNRTQMASGIARTSWVERAVLDTGGSAASTKGVDHRD